MCFPAAVPLVGAAMSAGGAYMGQQDANKQARAGVKARTRATEDEIARQRGFEAEGVAQRDKALNAVTTGQPLAALQARREAAMKSAITPEAGYNPAPGSAPKIVQGEIGRKGRDATSAASKAGARTGRLAAYGDQQANTGLALTDAQRRLATTSGAARGSYDLLPADIATRTFNATRTSGNPTFADMLGIGGTGLQLAGGLGAFDNMFSGAATAPKSPGMGRMTGRI